MVAKRLHVSYLESYQRLKAVGLIQKYLQKLDPLHTQSREYATDEVVSTLLRLEKEKGGKICILNQDIIEKHLRFIESEPLNEISNSL
jgi:hypothetical protein